MIRPGSFGVALGETPLMAPLNNLRSMNLEDLEQAPLFGSICSDVTRRVHTLRANSEGGPHA